MTDRELLELAAKAAGIDYGGYYGTPDKSIKSGLTRNEGAWNPLTDDGDAFRLAVDLSMEMKVSTEYGRTRVAASYPSKQYHTIHRVYENHGDDKHAATRRAIVLAAAEIGRVK